jgi:NhaA family Na+:H+ antiporter
MSGEHGNGGNLWGGTLLLAATILAMVLANSRLAGFYDLLLTTRIEFRIGSGAGPTLFEIAKPLTLWINDGLMAIFFFLVGMEIKREFIEGHLASLRQATLPLFGALGGVIVPALIFVMITAGDPEARRGWAIPMATDIAFAVAVVSALRSAVPVSLKAFLLALAIIDDLVAIVVIALFFTSKLSLVSMWLGLAGIAALVLLNRIGIRRLAPYVIVGIFTWACVLKSGVHATLAGVALGFAIPLSPRADGSSLLKETEHALSPWIAFGVLPLFAFANAGVSLTGIGLTTLFGVLPLGIALGLFVGKQIGVFAFAALAVKLRLASMPAGVGWLQFYGIALICGIGFTMSLFIGSLAFDDAARQTEIRLGVLVGSLLSTVAGVVILLLPRRPPPPVDGSPAGTAGQQ